jgi:predicted secreted Zn-dependent protease
MKKQGLLSMTINLFLLVFLVTALPLPSGLSERLGLTPIFGHYGEAPSGQVGGNVAQELAAVTILGGGQGNAREMPIREDKVTYDFGSDDVTCSRYEVFGDTKEELQRAITDLKNGNGPLEEKEGKRYAAYVIADYSIDYCPYIVGLTCENGEVAVELGTEAQVQREIHMCLPRFRTSNPAIRDDCRTEEQRIFSHEMEHVKAFRLCAETLQDTLDVTRVVGHGSNFWSAYVAARWELDKIVNNELDDTVRLANNLNIAFDKLTHHGLGLGYLKNRPCG